VTYSIRAEGARNLCDVVFRRMQLGITADRGVPQIESIAETAARELRWSADEKTSRIDEFLAEVQKEKRY